MAMDPALYFDVNGSSPMDGEVRASFLASAEAAWGNPSASHPAGLRARASIDQARARVAACLGAEEDEILFTSGGTESNNWALAALDEAFGAGRRRVIVSSIEHKSVLRSAEALERRGFELVRLDVGADGAIDLELLERLLTPETCLVAVMLANNETGVLQPAPAVGELCRSRGALYLCDAVAAYGRVPVDVGELGCDLLSLSSHKLHAPKGTGLLYVRRGALDSTASRPGYAPFPAWMHGCGQQRGLRGGTENTAGIVALAHAMELLKADTGGPERLRCLREHLRAGLVGMPAEVLFNGQGELLPNTLSAAFPGFVGSDLQAALGERGFSVAVGAAGSDGAPSHVLSAMGLTIERARSTLRFSLGRGHDERAVDGLLAALSELLVTSQPTSIRS